MKIAWITDSTAFIDNNLKKAIPDLYIVPMTILINGKEYNDGEDISPEQLFQKLREDNVEVKTSQPSIGAFEVLYKQLSENYDHLISVHVSSSFSGTYSSAIQAAQLLKDSYPSISVVDSKIISNPLTELILYGNFLASKGKKPTEIVNLIEKRIATSEAYVMVGSLEQLHRSGRMTGLAFYLGSMLSIKPILTIENGKLMVKEKVRNTKKGFIKMVDYLDEALTKKVIKRVSVFYGLNISEADEWVQQLKTRYPGIEFNPYPLGAVIGVHAGENTIGMSWFDEN